MKFIQQAYRGQNEWWAYLLTLLLLFVGWQLIGVIPLTITAWQHASDWETFLMSAAHNFTTLGIDSNLFLILVIITFLGGLLALLFGVKYIHRRSLTSLVTSRETIDWKRALYAFGVWFLLGVMMLSIAYCLAPEHYVWNFKPWPFLLLFLISFLLLPIQTSMEELLFRGYLMQGFGTWFQNSAVALVLSAVIFGLLHGLNPEVEKLGWITMVYYIGTGLVLGIMTLMDEGMELALGFHAANNVVAALFVTTDWTVFRTEALLVDISEPNVGWEMFVPVGILFPFVLALFSHKYGWTSWKEKIAGPVRRPLLIEEDEMIA